jgi:hypothetical protein
MVVLRAVRQTDENRFCNFVMHVTEAGGLSTWHLSMLTGGTRAALRPGVPNQGAFAARARSADRKLVRTAWLR